MVKNSFAVTALLCGSVMLGACGMWSDRDSGRSNQSSGRSSTASTQASGSQSQSRSQITQVQQALKSKGYDPGTSDGVMGASTQEALRKFQQANGLPVTGMVDGQTAKALGVSSSGSASSSGTTGSSSEGRGTTGSSGSSSRDSGSSGGSSGSSSSGSGSSGSSRSGSGSGGSGN